MRTTQELAKEAMQVQDACNILGISKSYAAAMQELWERLREGKQPVGLQDLQSHPIAVLWGFKLWDMHDPNSRSTYGDAYAECQRLTQEYADGVADALTARSDRSTAE